MHKAAVMVLLVGIPVLWLTIDGDATVDPVNTTEHPAASSTFERALLKALPDGSRIVKVEKYDGMRISFVECPEYKYILVVTLSDILGYQVPKDIPNSTFFDIEKLLKEQRVRKFRYVLPQSLDMKQTGVFLQEAMNTLES